MSSDYLVKLFEHNNWANRQVIQTCLPLPGEQLDAQTAIPAYGSIRQTLLHLVSGQLGYLALLTLPVDARIRVPLAFEGLLESARISGEGLLALARSELSAPLQARLQTTDGYYTQPWVVMLQAINHATEHREQIKAILTALGVPAPEVDGWAYALHTHALIPMPK